MILELRDLSDGGGGKAGGRCGNWFLDEKTQNLHSHAVERPVHWETESLCAIAWGEEGVNGAKERKRGRGSERSVNAELVGSGVCSSAIRVVDAGTWPKPHDLF